MSKEENKGCYRICKYYKDGGMFDGMECNHPIWTKEEKRQGRNAIITHENSHNGNVPEKCPIKNYKPMSIELEYWKRRCELAEKVISEIPGISEGTYLEYQDFIISSAAKEPFFTGGLAEHPIIKSKLYKAEQSIEEEVRSVIKEVWSDEIENNNTSKSANGKFISNDPFNKSNKDELIDLKVEGENKSCQD